MKNIPLTRGFNAIVDDEDYNELMQYNWCLHGNQYAARGYHRDGKLIIERMHQRIMGIQPKGYEIDHINGNTLDNRKCNLRVVTHQQNTFNTRRKNVKKVGVNPSRYKGVTWRNDRNKWRACITLDGKRHYIGLFDSQEEAALAYNEVAIKLFGKYAKLNEIQEETYYGKV